MTGDVEEILSHELREVAEHVEVPAMPALPAEPGRRARLPLLAAAAAVLVVAGGAAVLATRGDTPTPAPAPAPTTPATPGPTTTSSPTESPSASPSVAAVEIPRTPPTVPYVLGRQLYVDGTQLPGSWWSVQGGDSRWLALRADNTWWWGWGPKPQSIPGPHDTPPVVSPAGTFVAETTVENGQGTVTGFDTRAAGEGLGGLPVDLGDRQDGSLVTVRAVTDDGRVVVQGSRTALLWLPLVVDGGGPVDLTSTAPGVQFLASTPAGLVATYGSDSREGEPFLAELSDAGKVTRKAPLPAYDSLAVSPGGAWLAWVPPGTLGGEVTTVGSLEVQRVGGGGAATLTPPDGWGFRVEQWSWEDDDHLVATVAAEGAGEGDGADRLVRCSATAARCVLLPTR